MALAVAAGLMIEDGAKCEPHLGMEPSGNCAFEHPLWQAVLLVIPSLRRRGRHPWRHRPKNQNTWREKSTATLFKAMASMAEWHVCRLGRFLRQSCEAFSIFLVQLAITLVRSMLCDVEKVRGRGFAHDRMFAGVKGPLSMFYTHSSYLTHTCKSYVISYHTMHIDSSLHHS